MTRCINGQRFVRGVYRERAHLMALNPPTTFSLRISLLDSVSLVCLGLNRTFNYILISTLEHIKSDILCK